MDDGPSSSDAGRSGTNSDGSANVSDDADADGMDAANDSDATERAAGSDASVSNDAELHGHARRNGQRQSKAVFDAIA